MAPYGEQVLGGLRLRHIFIFPPICSFLGFKQLNLKVCVIRYFIFSLAEYATQLPELGICNPLII